MEHHGDLVLRQLNVQFNTEARIRSLTECRHGVLRCFRCIIVQASVGVEPFFKRGRIGLMDHPGHDHKEVKNRQHYNDDQYDC